MGSGTAHQLTSGPRWQEHLGDPASCPPAALMGLATRWWEPSQEQSGDTETASQGLLLRLKREIMTNAHFFLGDGETPAVLACCQDSSLKTHPFPLISKIGPQAFDRVRMCNNYWEREALLWKPSRSKAWQSGLVTSRMFPASPPEEGQPLFPGVFSSFVLTAHTEHTQWDTGL